jgi:hypothetical protein
MTLDACLCNREFRLSILSDQHVVGPRKSLPHTVLTFLKVMMCNIQPQVSLTVPALSRLLETARYGLASCGLDSARLLALSAR